MRREWQMDYGERFGVERRPLNAGLLILCALAGWSLVCAAAICAFWVWKMVG